jgi:UDP-glucuronate 4-epimerase
MACFIFAKAILEKRPIEIYNHGDMKRDFTYIDDVVEGVVRVIDKPPLEQLPTSTGWPCSLHSSAPHRIYNIGRASPVRLMEFIEAIEQELGQKAIKKMLPMQLGDVQSTWADTKDFVQDFNYQPTTSIQTGIKRFTEWYLSYHGA